MLISIMNNTCSRRWLAAADKSCGRSHAAISTFFAAFSYTRERQREQNTRGKLATARLFASSSKNCKMPTSSREHFLSHFEPSANLRPLFCLSRAKIGVWWLSNFWQKSCFVPSLVHFFVVASKNLIEIISLNVRQLNFLRRPSGYGRILLLESPPFSALIVFLAARCTEKCKRRFDSQCRKAARRCFSK